MTETQPADYAAKAAEQLGRAADVLDNGDLLPDDKVRLAAAHTACADGWTTLLRETRD